MSISFDVSYKHPTTRKWTKGSQTISLKTQFVPEKNSIKIMLSAGGSSQPCDVDITQIAEGMLMGRRTSPAFQPWRSDGYARLSTNYDKTTDVFTFTVYGAQAAAPEYGAVNSGSFPNGCIACIYDSIDEDGAPVNLETFAVASTTATTIVGIKDGAAFDNDHPQGAIIKRVDVENALAFLFFNQGINRGESYKAQMEKPTGISSSNITVTDGGSQTISYVYNGGTAHSYAFTPYVDIYVRSHHFTHIEEWWEPDYNGATQQKNRTLAQIASTTIDSYDGDTAAGGGALTAGDWWVGTVVKDASATFNVNESLPTVKMVQVA